MQFEMEMRRVQTIIEELRSIKEFYTTPVRRDISTPQLFVKDEYTQVINFERHKKC